MEPTISDKEISFLRRALFTKREELVAKIGLLTFKGRMMWGTKKMNLPFFLRVTKDKVNNIETDYEFIIKHVQSLSYG